MRMKWKIGIIGRSLSTRSVSPYEIVEPDKQTIEALLMTTLLALEVLLGLLLQLELLPLHSLAEFGGGSLLVGLVLLLLLSALRSTTGKRLVEEVLVLASASGVAARALGDVRFTRVHVDQLWTLWTCLWEVVVIAEHR